MSIFTFPYQRKTIEEGEIPDPRVSLDLESPHRRLKVKFLVDSGADVTTLPLVPYAKLLEAKIESHRKIMIGGIEGRGVAAHPVGLTVRLGRKVFPLRSYFLESPIDPLLGRLDFWQLFSVNFDNRKKRTILQELKI